MKKSEERRMEEQNGIYDKIVLLWMRRVRTFLFLFLFIDINEKN